MQLKVEENFHKGCISIKFIKEEDEIKVMKLCN